MAKSKNQWKPFFDWLIFLLGLASFLPIIYVTFVTGLDVFPLRFPYGIVLDIETVALLLVIFGIPVYSIYAIGLSMVYDRVFDEQIKMKKNPLPYLGLLMATVSLSFYILFSAFLVSISQFV